MVSNQKAIETALSNQTENVVSKKVLSISEEKNPPKEM